MRSRKALVSLTAVLMLAGPAPSAVIAYGENPASRYDRCFTKAEESLHGCLEYAGPTEVLCWSRFGYAKIWCSLRYVVTSIID